MLHCIISRKPFLNLSRISLAEQASETISLFYWSAIGPSYDLILLESISGLLIQIPF
jgi:hypothetical protein